MSVYVLLLSLTGVLGSCSNMLQDLTQKTVDGTGTGTGTGTTLTINKSKLSLVSGTSETLSVAEAANSALTWSSSEPMLVSVSGGTVTADGIGNAIITATTADGKSSAFCVVTSTANTVVVTGVSLNKSRTTLSVNGTETLLSSAIPAWATDSAVTWTSDDSAVASVSSVGKVTGVSAGTATITATAADTTNGTKTVSCSVTVLASSYSLYSLSLNKSSTTILTSESETLYARFIPVFTTGQSISWSSSDASVALVDQSGMVTGVKAGTATISASSGGKTADCAVSVTDTPNGVTTVALDLNKTTALIVPGGYEQLTPVITPSAATNQNVVWTSSNPAVATVDQTGLICGVAEGMVDILATCGGQNVPCNVTVSAEPNSWQMVKGSSDVRVLAAAAGTGKSNPGVWVSTDYGYTWKQVYSSDVWGVSVSSSGQYMVLHKDGALKYSHDYGSTWSDSTITDKTNIEGSAMSGDGSIVYLAQYQDSHGNSGAIWKSSDYGVTFSNNPSPAGYFNTISCSGDGTNVAAGTVYNSNYLHHSSDSGSTYGLISFTPQNSSEIRRMLMAKSGTQVIAGDEYGWLRSSSGSNLWTSWSAFFGSSVDMHKFGQLSATYNTDGTFKTIFASASYNTANSPEFGIMSSTDLGATWTTLLASDANGGSIGYWTSLVPANDGKIMVATSASTTKGGIYVCLDGSLASPDFVRRY